MKLKSLTVDSKRANEGAWVKDIPGMGDLELKVRGYTFPDYRALVASESSKVAPHDRREGRPDGPVNQPAMDKITGRAMAALILLDWKNLEGDDGQPIPYDIDKAIVFLTHPDYRPFNSAVDWAAQEVERVESTRVQASMGNSSPASVTS